MAAPGTTYSYLSNQSMTSTFAGEPQEVGANRELELALDWSGTTTGTLSLQVRFGTKGTWTTVSDATFPTNPAGSSGQGLANFHDVPGDWWRLVYTAAAGTGVLAVLAKSY